MKGELTAVIEATADGGYWATCLEMSGANGQGETVQEAKADLLEAVRLILKDREEDVLRGLPSDAICEPLLIG